MRRRVLAVVVLGLAVPAAALAKAPRAGGIGLGTWKADLGSAGKVEMKLIRMGHGRNAAAALKLFQYTGPCIFAPDSVPQGQPVPAPITVTWTFRGPRTNTGPVEFLLHPRRASHGTVDLDQNRPGPMSLRYSFKSASKATGVVFADESTPQGTCFTGKGVDDTRVPFTIRRAGS